MEAVARHAARRPMPVAVVADVSNGAGLTALRSLARAGVPVLALDHRPDAAGLRSRHALALLGPDPGGVGLRALLGEVERALDRPPVVIPTSAEYARALAGDAATARLGNGVRRRALAACLVEGEPAAVFAAERDGDGGPWRARSPADDVSSNAVELLRERYSDGLAWLELTADGVPVEAGAYLWPEHALALRHGVDLPRIAYWAALGARLPAPSTNGAGGPRLDRLAAAADPGPALAAAARIVRGLAP